MGVFHEESEAISDIMGGVESDFRSDVTKSGIQYHPQQMDEKEFKYCDI